MESSTWVSFDLDWATGDCRGERHHCCSWKCVGCEGKYGLGRGMGDPRPDALEQFAQMREWLLSLQIETVLFYDCHADIFKYLSAGDSVLNFDEHSDDGFVEWAGKLNCGNWVSFAREIDVTVKQMNNLPFPAITEPVKLFVARSLPYTSPICDDELLRLIKDIVIKGITPND